MLSDQRVYSCLYYYLMATITHRYILGKWFLFSQESSGQWIIKRKYGRYQKENANDEGLFF